MQQDEHDDDDIPNEITSFKTETLQRAEEEESDKILKNKVMLLMNACNIHLLGSQRMHFDTL